MKVAAIFLVLIHFLSFSGFTITGSSQAASMETADNPDDVYWEGFPTPSFPDRAGEINALTVYSEKLVAGGKFEAIDGVDASSIAAFDGTEWAALGQGVHGTVLTLAVYGDKLIAGGLFTVAGGNSVGNIAAWDGSSWTMLGTGMDSAVSILTVYNGKLIAVGDFATAGGVDANGIAAWDGSVWSTLGSGLDGDVSALVVYDNKLTAGGNFSTAGGVSAQNIATWNGTLWSAFGDDTFGARPVLGMAVYQNKLIVSSGRSGTHYWDGLSWNSTCPELVPCVTEGCYVAGVLTGCDSLLVVTLACWEDVIVPHFWNEVAVWSDSSWSALGISSLPRAVTCFSDELVTTAGSTIISWDGATESLLASRVVGADYASIGALTVYDNKLIAAGDFTDAISDTVHNPAAWDGSSWSALGLGIRGSVGTLTVHDNLLVAGGQFSSAGGVAANNIASWGGASWSALGSGSKCVTTLTPLDENLMTGSVGSTCPSSLHCTGVVGDVCGWNGSSWWSLGLPEWGTAGGVYASCTFGNKLFVHYRYNSFDCTMPSSLSWTTGLTVWDRSSWTPVVRYAGINSVQPKFDLASLLEYDGNLITAGEFDSVGGVMTNNIAAWDGNSWSSLGEGIHGSVTTLTIYGNELVAGGRFDSAGNVAANNIAVWNGSAWSALGSGVNGGVTCLTVFDGKLAVGGIFTRAGGKESRYLAVWTKPSFDCGDANGSGTVNLADIVYMVNWIFAGGPAPFDAAAGDYNCDGRTNIGDAVYLVNYLYVGGAAPCSACP